jgi:predicted RNA binding protein YcfA (HicA-like mRNA interferase family)
MDSRTVIRLIEADGWRIKNVVGSHHQFYHPLKPGKVTVSHPLKDIPPGTLHNISKQAGIKLIRR